MSELLFERAQLKHVLPLWDTTQSPERPLTPFLEEIKELCIDWATRIREKQQQTPTVQAPEPAPERGPTKIGTGVRQVADNELPRRI